MPSPLPRHGVAVALALVVVAMKLAACSGPIDPTPPDPHETQPNPHEAPEGGVDPTSDPPPDAGDAADGAP